MATGRYSLDVPAGAHKVIALKDNNSVVVDNVNVFESQTTEVNFQLGGDNMEHIVDINVANCEEETIAVPDGCTTKSYKFNGAISGNLMVGKTVQLIASDGVTVVQTGTTDANGVVAFTNVIYGDYKLKITY